MKDGKAYKYALWCATEQERKVPEYVKKQAESWLKTAGTRIPDLDHANVGSC